MEGAAARLSDRQDHTAKEEGFVKEEASFSKRFPCKYFQREGGILRQCIIRKSPLRNILKGYLLQKT